MKAHQRSNFGSLFWNFSFLDVLLIYQMSNYIRRVTLFALGNTIRELVETVVIGNYVHRVIVIKG